LQAGCSQRSTPRFGRWPPRFERSDAHFVLTLK
jgi:hypothetical protein